MNRPRASSTWPAIRRVWRALERRLRYRARPLIPVDADIMPAGAAERLDGDPEVLRCAAGVRVRFRLTIPADARLRVTLQRTGGGRRALECSVHLHQAGEGRLIAHVPLVRRARLHADLRPWAGRSVELELRTAAMPGAPTDAGAVEWIDPALLATVPAADAWQDLVATWRTRGLRGGIAALRSVAAGRSRGGLSPHAYRLWLGRHEPAVFGTPGSAPGGPAIDLCTPVRDPVPAALAECIEAVRAQTYGSWRWRIVDDGSTDTRVRALLRSAAADDPRITVHMHDRPEGIAAASNRALGLATAEWTAWIDHDDRLRPDALAMMAEAIHANPGASCFYSDEDKLEPTGDRSSPFWKPGWSPERLRAGMYVGHLLVYRTALLRALGGFRSEFDGAQDYDLALRAMEHAGNFVHVPHTLYHWRKVPGSTAADHGAKPGALPAAEAALRDHCARAGTPASVHPTRVPGVLRPRPAVAGDPLVSVVIPSRDNAGMLARCIAGLHRTTAGRRVEIVIVDNGSTAPDARRYLAAVPHAVVRLDAPFNFSALVNAGAERATGEYLLLLNDDVEPHTPGWLTALLEAAQFPGVGVVGAKLCYPDGRLQHAGIALDPDGVARNVGRGAPGTALGDHGAWAGLRNCAAVSAACLLVPRELFEQLGGFEPALPADFNDVDFCLRVRAAGRRVAWTPFAELRHDESASRPPGVDPEAVRWMRQRWGDQLAQDPYERGAPA
ncbi:MAG: glycosyltransferase [Planctomycetota bacterium]